MLMYPRTGSKSLEADPILDLQRHDKSEVQRHRTLRIPQR